MYLQVLEAVIQGSSLKCLLLKLVVKQILNCFVSINFLPTIFLILYKTHQRQAFWMTRTCKNPKFVCVKLFGKIGPTLTADLADVIVNHLKSIFRTLGTICEKMGKMSVSRVFNKIIIFVTESIKKSNLWLVVPDWTLFSQKSS